MIAETLAYKILSKDKTLNELFDQFRGSVFGNNFNQGIFTYDIPETPTNLKKAELAPFMRINNTYDGPTNYADDSLLINEQRITINFWCKSASQADLINNALDSALEAKGFIRYTANENPRYKDNDIGLLMNVRKYRFFDWK